MHSDSTPSKSPDLLSPTFSFQPTRWSLVRRAAFRGDVGDPDLNEFCRIYWYPLFAAARRLGQSPENACDAVQTLFAGLIAKETLRRADPGRGRLRSWLLTLLQNQIRSGARAARAAKRGGGQVPFALDSATAEAAFASDPGFHEGPGAAWSRNLAAALLDEAVEALAASYRATGKEALFEALVPALEGPLSDATWQETADRLGTTASALRMAVFRLRGRFRRILRAKASAALGVDDGPLLDRELRDLFSGGL
jgi:DNA-directed RNA polymerase specialized sigma24 family protein